MLSLIARDHINGLLDQIKIELLLATLGCKIKISVYKILCAGIEKRVYVGLRPTALLNGLETGIKVIKPLFNISLIWLQIIIPRRVKK
jgi:hypothetical protein